MSVEDITQEDWAVVRKFRDNGFAIVMFNEEELRGASQDDVEDRLIELGWDVIDAFATEPEEPEEPAEDI
jgi:hypothetical protein